MIDSRCGLHCTGCGWKESHGCGGCIETNGHPFHGACPVAACCQDKGFVHCGECPEIPCALLTQFSYDKKHGDDGARIEQCKKWADHVDFYIQTGKENMQIPVVGRLLRATYWAGDRSDEVIEKSMLKSDCYGAFLTETGLQIGFSRVVTDDATFFWLCDVVVDENYRGHGVGKKLMETIRNESKYQPMAGILGTLDAHGLYEKYGFARSGDEKLMRKPQGV